MNNKKSLSKKVKEYKQQIGYDKFTKEEKEKVYNDLIENLHAFPDSNNQDIMKILFEFSSQRYCTIKESKESLETSLQQMKLMREGKLPKKTWQEFQKELENHREDIYALAEQNTPKNSKGQACIKKDDDWADEDCWDEYYEKLISDNKTDNKER
jgi:hypothetical protein